MSGQVCFACNASVPAGQFHCSSCGSTNIGTSRTTSVSASSETSGWYFEQNSSTMQAQGGGYIQGADASRGLRFGGYLLDIALSWVTFGLGWFVWMLIIAPRGLTPAKQIIGMKIVVPGTTFPAAWWKVAMRHYAPLLVGIVISPFSMFGLFSLPFAFALLLTVLQFAAAVIPIVDALFIFGPRRQRLVDMIFRTAVITGK